MSKKYKKIRPARIKPLEVIDASKEYKQIIILFLQKIEILNGVERRMITDFMGASSKTACLVEHAEIKIEDLLK